MLWALPRQACFNTQPPEGGWGNNCYATRQDAVSTHSRPKAAGSKAYSDHAGRLAVSTHSRPKAAGNNIFQDH